MTAAATHLRQDSACSLPAVAHRQFGLGGEVGHDEGLRLVLEPVEPLAGTAAVVELRAAVAWLRAAAPQKMVPADSQIVHILASNSAQFQKKARAASPVARGADEADAVLGALLP